MALEDGLAGEVAGDGLGDCLVLGGLGLRTIRLRLGSINLNELVNERLVHILLIL